MTHHEENMIEYYHDLENEILNDSDNDDDDFVSQEEVSLFSNRIDYHDKASPDMFSQMSPEEKDIYLLTQLRKYIINNYRNKCFKCLKDFELKNLTCVYCDELPDKYKDIEKEICRKCEGYLHESGDCFECAEGNWNF